MTEPSPHPIAAAPSPNRILPIGRTVRVPAYGEIVLIAVIDREDGWHLLFAELQASIADVQAGRADSFPKGILQISDDGNRWYAMAGGGGGGRVLDESQPYWMTQRHGFTPALAPAARVLFLRSMSLTGDPDAGREVAVPLDGSQPITEDQLPDAYGFTAMQVLDQAVDVPGFGPARFLLVYSGSDHTAVALSRTRYPDVGMGVFDLTDDLGTVYPRAGGSGDTGGSATFELATYDGAIAAGATALFVLGSEINSPMPEPSVIQTGARLTL